MAVGVGMFAGNILPYISEYIKIKNNIKIKYSFIDSADLIDSTMYLEQIDKMKVDLFGYSANIIKFIIIVILIVLVIFFSEKVIKKKLSSIKIIILGAILGIAINFIL